MRRRLTLTLLVLIAGCSRTPAPSTAPIKRYQLQGEIVRLEPKLPSAVIKHQKIEGWMEAMTMEFPVKDRQEYDRLHVGDQIRATVFVQDLDYWVGDIRPVPKTDSAPRP